MERVERPTDLTVARLVARAARRGEGVSASEPDRQRRGAHLLLGALDLSGPDRARLAARGARLAGVDRRAAADRRRPRLGLGGRHAPARRSRTSSTTPPRPASAWCSGSLVGLWSASGYIGAFIRASNEIYEVEEDRPFWKLRPLQLLITLVMTRDPRRGPDRARAHRAAGDGDRRRARGRRHRADRCSRSPSGRSCSSIVVRVIGLLYRFSPNARARRACAGSCPASAAGDGALARRLGGVQPLRRQLRLLREHLRQPRRRDRLPGLALAHATSRSSSAPSSRRARAHRARRPSRRRRPASGFAPLRLAATPSPSRISVRSSAPRADLPLMTHEGEKCAVRASV